MNIIGSQSGSTSRNIAVSQVQLLRRPAPVCACVLLSVSYSCHTKTLAAKNLIAIDKTAVGDRTLHFKALLQVMRIRIVSRASRGRMRRVRPLAGFLIWPAIGRAAGQLERRLPAAGLTPSKRFKGRTHLRQGCALFERSRVSMAYKSSTPAKVQILATSHGPESKNLVWSRQFSHCSFRTTGISSVPCSTS